MKVYFAHATSFCGGVWDPVIGALPDLESVTWDFAGHGSGPALTMPVDWTRFGEQVLDETEPGGVGVGHSMGGAALVMAQLADPGRFQALVLIEPIVYPGPHGRLEHPLSAIALKRKSSFPSRDAALENFATTRAFSNWNRSALEGYVRCGLIGDGPVELACSPEIEADVYRGSNAHPTWDSLGDVTVPVLVISGAESDTIPPQLARDQAARFQRGGVEIVPDTGHFLPMERPSLVADRVSRLAAVAF